MDSYLLILCASISRDGISYVGTHHRQRKTHQTVVYLNAIQKFLREETRLGIPALGIGEGLHGYMAHEATSFLRQSVWRVPGILICMSGYSVWWRGK